MNDIVDAIQLNNLSDELPTGFLCKHWEELMQSGISPKIAILNFQSLEDAAEVDKLLARNTDKRWKHSTLAPAWSVTGVDPKTGERNFLSVQVKPDSPPTPLDGSKPPKYLSASNQGSHPLFLDTGKIDYWQRVKGDLSLDVVETEGAKKVASLLSIGQAAISVAGVNNGQKKGRLNKQLKEFYVPGRSVYLAYDADWRENLSVYKAIDRQSRLIAEAGAVPYIVCWDKIKGKGIDDYLTSFPPEQRAIEWEELKAAALTFEEWRDEPKPQPRPNPNEDLIGRDDKGNRKLKPASFVANILREELATQLAYNCEIDEFYRYGSEVPGVWSIETSAFIKLRIQTELDARGASGLYSAGYVSSIFELMKAYLAVRNWDEAIGLLPLRNGVLNLATNKLEPHNPGYRFTWQLPYAYNIVATCEPIIEWLTEAQDGDSQRVQLLRAYLKAVVTGRSDLQRYLECLGAGGTGKSTFANLAVALVGIENTAITTLEQLEKNRFETAHLRNKRLLYITDSERYSGSVSIFKAVTGGDPIRNEEKFKQAGKPFVAQLMALIVANEPISSTDYTSGLERRRLTVPFMKRVVPKDRRDLLTITHAGMSGEFVPHLPGLLNWVLAMSDQEMRALLLDTTLNVPSLTQWKAETLIETNPIAEWLDSCCILDPSAKTYIGIAEKVRDTSGEPGNSTTREYYRNNREWLYANYRQFCDRTGSNAVKLQRFSRLVMDLLTSQLNVEAWKRKDNKGAYIEGIALRKPDDQTSPRPIIESDGFSDGFADPVTVEVTPKTRISDDFDDCDDYFSYSFENRNTSHAQEPGHKEKSVQEIVKTEGLINVSQKPSEPSKPSLARIPVVAKAVTGNELNRHGSTKNNFRKGDRVRVVTATEGMGLTTENVYFVAMLSPDSTQVQLRDKRNRWFSWISVENLELIDP